MLRFPLSTRRSPDIDQELRERIATAIEGLTTFHSRTRVKDLRHTGHDIASTHEFDRDGDYSVWRHELENKRVITGFSADSVGYRVASEREQAHTGKPWIAFKTACEGTAGDESKTWPLLVRTARQPNARRMTTVGGREAAVHSFAFDELADRDDPRARGITAWIRDHRVRRMVLVVTTDADDGELLGLRLQNRSMVTCTTPSRYCRSRADLHGFGQPVAPKPDTPSEDQIYWLPTNPPRHR